MKEKKDEVEETKEPSTQDEGMNLEYFKETTEFLDLEEDISLETKESNKTMLVAPGIIIPSHLNNFKTPEQVSKKRKH